jgi:hypothetical protein
MLLPLTTQAASIKLWKLQLPGRIGAGREPSQGRTAVPVTCLDWLLAKHCCVIAFTRQAFMGRGWLALAVAVGVLIMAEALLCTLARSNGQAR